MSKPQKIEAGTIKEYLISSLSEHKRAVYLDIEGDLIYMDVIEKGKISLYASVTYVTYGTGRYTYSHSLIDYFIVKGSDYVTWLAGDGHFKEKTKIKQERKNYFEELLKDKPEVYKKYLADNEFDFETIRNIVHLYDTGQPYKKPEPYKNKNIEKEDNSSDFNPNSN